nr:hypothetical protein [Tanacetum cinerariifolium]
MVLCSILKSPSYSFYSFAVNRESARDVHSKRRIIAVTDLKIVEWHSYKHIDWITVRRDDDKLYKFKEGDFKRLRIQDIEDMLQLLVQGKLTNLTVEECFAFNVSLRMFTKSIVIQRLGGEEGHVEADEEDELYRDVNINQGRGIQANLEVEDSHVTLILVNPDEANFSEAIQTNQFAGAVSAIPGIVQRYMDQRIIEAVKMAAMNEQLEAEVLTRSSHSSKTSYAVATDLSEMELKKILIEKIE